ncbi:heme peroxidase [Mycena rosella]|uniref:Peroxidase n=1 Tax=Mycena rosella TaxID=1033263 RepID=A0AAD7G3I6_MYCRO|nr:heme peroxidase [Mycena rosella]
MLPLSLTLLVTATTARAYVWPSPQLDALESARWDQSGYRSHATAAQVTPCNLYLFGTSADKTGRTNAADWIRTAYHDMATHNVADGTGGLDASIRFPEEQARAENSGNGFSNTVSVFTSDRYISLADNLALAMIIAVENCGGPEIAPSTPTPPGFTPTEMIGLVACGHTFGGVQHAVFPDVVPELNDPNNTESSAPFDTTVAHFDNHVATEYISGTTQNPLVVGLNETKNSDKRIFASDSNATMLSFANSPDTFASTCADLFARMVDTVPSAVQLTDVITPLPVKPSSLQLTLNGDTLTFNGEVRFWNMAEDATRMVRLLWDDHVGGANNVTLSFAGVSSAAAGRYSAAWYSFGSPSPLTFTAAAGIKSMRFAVNSELEDQGGAGFALQDGVVFSTSSCLISHSPWAARIDVAVRNGLNPARVFLEAEARDSVNRTIVVETDLSPAGATGTVYSIWSVKVDNASPVSSWTICAEVDGVKIAADGSTTSLLSMALCAASTVRVTNTAVCVRKMARYVTVLFDP